MPKYLSFDFRLAVADAKLGNAIKEKLDLDCVYDSKVLELMRCIRSQMSGLISGIRSLDLYIIKTIKKIYIEWTRSMLTDSLSKFFGLLKWHKD